MEFVEKRGIMGVLWRPSEGIFQSFICDFHPPSVTLSDRMKQTSNLSTKTSDLTQNVSDQVEARNDQRKHVPRSKQNKEVLLLLDLDPLNLRPGGSQSEGDGLWALLRTCWSEDRSESSDRCVRRLPPDLLLRFFFPPDVQIDHRGGTDSVSTHNLHQIPGLCSEMFIMFYIFDCGV